MKMINLALIIVTCSFTFSCYTQSLKFTASSANDFDRVKIKIDHPHKAVDVCCNFTIEFWMKADPGVNNAGPCQPSEWYYGNVIVDRDVFGGGDFGDYGFVLCGRKLVFGIEKGSGGTVGLKSTSDIDNGSWHHVAVTRNYSNGTLKLFINGVAQDSLNIMYPLGDISYRNNRSTTYPSSDPYLVFGAEKHDYPGSLYYNGWLDELRISDTIRYMHNFSPGSHPFVKDRRTAALYHFDESVDTILYDDSLYPESQKAHGIIKRNNINGPPFYSDDTPFLCNGTVTNSSNSGNYSLRDLIACTSSGSKIYISQNVVNQTLQILDEINIIGNIEIINLNTHPVLINQNHLSTPLFNIHTGAQLFLQNINMKRIVQNNNALISNKGTFIPDKVSVLK